METFNTINTTIEKNIEDIINFKLLILLFPINNAILPANNTNITNKYPPIKSIIMTYTLYTIKY